MDRSIVSRLTNIDNVLTKGVKIRLSTKFVMPKLSKKWWANFHNESFGL